MVGQQLGQRHSRGDSKSKEVRKDGNSLMKNNVSKFLDKIPKLPSHYCRSSISKLYLEPHFSSFSELYRVFKEECNSYNNIQPVAGRDLFVKLIKEHNIALFKPKKDECDLCLSYKLHNVSDDDYNAHQLKKERARQEKSVDKKEAEEGKCCVFTMDVQAVQLVPATQASSMYFKQKLTCHNFTIYNLGDGSVVCYVWHEGEGGLDAHVFATCIANFLDT
ncbi:hypothetical protein ANN_19425 [Periplaneta americana]|uniref:Uncharacterized protein n=1 Tax=Periplaneta americana TaxID=6978 RepID=A0ABQ8SAE6_PERAM|nr:hypothetical protein ANN_19425 [Periplaneta americana]